AAIAGNARSPRRPVLGRFVLCAAKVIVSGIAALTFSERTATDRVEITAGRPELRQPLPRRFRGGISENDSRFRNVSAEVSRGAISSRTIGEGSTLAWISQTAEVHRASE